MTDPRRLLDDGSSTSPALRSLLESAKQEDEPREQRVAALTTRLAPLLTPLAAMPPPPPVTAPVAAAGKSALAIKAGAAVVAAGLVGGGAWYLHDRAHVAQVAPAPAREPVPVPEAPIPAPPAPTPELPQTPLALPAHPRPSTPAVDPAAEAALVQSAEAALVGGDGANALALTREHATRFPAGAHAEERDRIAIEALVRLGRAGDAHAAAERFFARYPRSIYRARVEALLR
jgi:hypothetical protein